MNCFYHRTIAAVGICKSCGKALCGLCAAELKNGLACKDSCEDRVNLLNRIIDNNSRSLKIANSQLRSGAIMIFTLGIFFLALAGVCFAENNQFLSMFLGAPGAIFTIYGLMRLLAPRYPTLESPSREPDSPNPNA